MSEHADIVFVNGLVVTVDEHFSIAEALAASGEEIIAVGDRTSVEALVGPDTRVVDLDGGTLLPGINDSHLHGCAYGIASPPLALDVAFPTVRSVADIADAVRRAAESTPAGQWIIGIGWDTGYLDECLADPSRLPTRADLDAVSPDHPVMLQDFSGHASWVNSAALALAGVDRDTVPPPGGIIIRDAEGKPTGLLQEGAQSFVHAVQPALTKDVRRAAVLSTLAKLRELGITSYTEPGLGPGGEQILGGGLGHEGLTVYRELLETGELTARVSVLLLPTGLSSTAAEFTEALDGMDERHSADPRLLNVVGVKVFADGIPPNKSSWMHEEYVGGGCGCLSVAGETDEQRVEQISEMIRHAHASGYQVGVHVTGDRGIDTVVEAFAKAAAEHPRKDARHYLIHGDFLTPRSMKTLAEHGFGVNMNPTIKWTIADLEVEFVGPERAAYEWPYRDAVDAGLRVMSSSDAPVTYPDWRQGIATMMLRESKATGTVSGPEQRIGLADAVRTYTTNGAWQDFAEDWKGSLEVGKVADLCVLGGDLLTVDPREIPALPVRMTVVGGQVVHDRTD